MKGSAFLSANKVGSSVLWKLNKAMITSNDVTTNGFWSLHQDVNHLEIQSQSERKGLPTILFMDKTADFIRCGKIFKWFPVDFFGTNWFFLAPIARPGVLVARCTLPDHVRRPGESELNTVRDDNHDIKMWCNQDVYRFYSADPLPFFLLSSCHICQLQFYAKTPRQACFIFTCISATISGSFMSPFFRNSS